MSTFVVLRPDGDGWREFARVEATTAATAIEKAATEPGEYIAVTEGRFKPMTVQPVQSLRVVNAA